MLKIENLVKNYGKFKAVDNLNLNIEDGAIFGFVGPNGAGKTTTMKIMAGLLGATSGIVEINGVDVINSPLLLKEKMGYMPDFFGVYDNLRVDEYMDFYAGTYEIPYNDRGVIIDNLLELVDLRHKKNDYVDGLSRGMKQRLCLARSMVHDPEILILDEPASGLDPRARIEMKEVLKQLKTLGKTIIISSHILPELAEMCTEIGIIDNGKMVDVGTVNDIMSHISKDRIIMIKPLNNVETMVRILEECPNVSKIVVNTDNTEFSYCGEDVGLANLITNIVKNDVPILYFKEKEGNLEDIFMQLTGGGEGND